MKLPRQRGVCVCLALVDAGKQLSKVVHQFRVTKTWWCRSLHFSVSGVEVPHYGFTWHFFLMIDEIIRKFFSDDWWAPSHTFIDHLEILFHEVPVQVLPSFSIRLSFEAFYSHTHSHTQNWQKGKQLVSSIMKWLEQASIYDIIRMWNQADLAWFLVLRFCLFCF